MLGMRRLHWDSFEVGRNVAGRYWEILGGDRERIRRHWGTVGMHWGVLGCCWGILGCAGEMTRRHGGAAGMHWGVLGC